MATFDTLPLELIQRIALLSVCNLVGSIQPLFALLCTCRAFNFALSNVPHLYASIFFAKCDTDAPSRRFSERWMTTRCLAAEFKKRWAALGRIKRRELVGGLDDLYTAYLMLLEADGRNEAQLFDYADLTGYMLHLVQTRRTSLDWLGETHGTSLCVWLLWMSHRHATIQLEPPAVRNMILGALHPLMTASNRFPTIYCPDTHYDLPLTTSLAAHSSGPTPPVTTITHYSHQLTLSAPPLVPAAMLNIVTRIEATLMLANPTFPENHPPTRAAALSIGFQGPSIEDLVEFQSTTRINHLERSVVRTEPKDEADLSGSRQHEQDWFRIVSCTNPRTQNSPLRGAVYRLGSIAGEWGGRLFFPVPNESGQGHDHTQKPMYVNFQEHHCLDYQMQIPPGNGRPTHGLDVPRDDEEFGDDILNAWLPRGIHVYHVDQAIDVLSPATNKHYRYHTYSSTGPSRYSKSAEAQAQANAAAQNHRAESPPCVPDKEYLPDLDFDEAAMVVDVARSSATATYIDDDDECEDTVEHLSTGVSDILITGRTPARYAPAWGDWTYLGRVRAWDGLVVLLRRSAHPAAHDQSRWIFKGYIHHGNNFVGRWRETATRASLIELESGFALGRQ